MKTAFRAVDPKSGLMVMLCSGVLMVALYIDGFLRVSHAAMALAIILQVLLVVGWLALQFGSSNVRILLSDDELMFRDKGAFLGRLDTSRQKDAGKRLAQGLHCFRLQDLAKVVVFGSQQQRWYRFEMRDGTRQEYPSFVGVLLNRRMEQFMQTAVAKFVPVEIEVPPS